MSIGMNSTINTTLDFVERVGNTTNFLDFFVAVNNDVYNGYLYFLLLLVLWIIMTIVLMRQSNTFAAEQIINNIVYSGAVITIISFLLRGIYFTRYGVVEGLLTDKLLWVFPLITILFATVLVMMKRD